MSCWSLRAEFCDAISGRFWIRMPVLQSCECCLRTFSGVFTSLSFTFFSTNWSAFSTFFSRDERGKRKKRKQESRNGVLQKIDFNCLKLIIQFRRTFRCFSCLFKFCWRILWVFLYLQDQLWGVFLVFLIKIKNKHFCWKHVFPKT